MGQDRAGGVPFPAIFDPGSYRIRVAGRLGPEWADRFGGLEIVVGDLHTCVRRATGRVTCWGDNSHGQLGVSILYSDLKFAYPLPVVCGDAGAGCDLEGEPLADVVADAEPSAAVVDART